MAKEAAAATIAPSVATTTQNLPETRCHFFQKEEEEEPPKLLHKEEAPITGMFSYLVSSHPGDDLFWGGETEHF